MRDVLLTALGGLSTFYKRHPKGVLVTLAALSLGAGSGALAIATLGPDASDLPVQQVLETVQPAALAQQTEQLATQTLSLYRTEVSRSSDSADTLLRRLGINDPEAANFLRRDPLANQVVLGRAGRNVSVEASANNTLIRMRVLWQQGDDGQFKRLVIEKSGSRWVSQQGKAELQASTRLASGVIRSSLFAATDEAHIPDAVANQMADIFSGDIDFHRSLRQGDRFAIVYETLEADGEPVRSGRVLSAEFVNNGKTYQAMWFQESGQSGGYYTLDGQSMHRAYLTSPVAFSRITSSFKMRFHPILQKWRAHTGVDYAAPTGTPVRTVGDGVVEFAGVQNGYGNVVFVQHRNGQSTVYAHLSKVNVKRGQSVLQGQNIGLVGSTGWATGPHLHFEFRVNGKFQDPLTVARQSEAIPVSASARPRFNQLAAELRPELVAAASLQRANAQ